MLWFLSIAAGRGYVVDSYQDAAVGVMARNEHQGWWIAEVILNPHITCSGARQPTIEEKAEMHHAAHTQCFIANSIKTAVVVNSAAPAPSAK